MDGNKLHFRRVEQVVYHRRDFHFFCSVVFFFSFVHVSGCFAAEGLPCLYTDRGRLGHGDSEMGSKIRTTLAPRLSAGVGERRDTERKK